MWLEDIQFSQYCEENDLLSDIDIPLYDTASIEMYPEYAWIYDKRRILDHQNMKWFRHGKPKPDFIPCFSKPIENLWGMGIGTSLCEDAEDYTKNYRPAHICMEVLAGEHSTVDVIINEGKFLDWRITVGHSLGEGKFSYWETLPLEPNQELTTLDRRRFVLNFVEAHLPRYKGAVNFEFIDGKCIEVHLRPNVEMMFAWGPKYIKQIKYFYNEGTWHPITEDIGGCVIPIWGKLNKAYKMKLADRVKFSVAEGINFVYYDIDNKEEANPPGGQRLAFVAGNDYEKCKQTAEELNNYFNG